MAILAGPRLHLIDPSSTEHNIVLVVYKYSWRSRNMKHAMSTAKDNTVVCFVLYKHAP